MINQDVHLEGLSDASQIGVLGDLHGDMTHTFKVIDLFARRSITTLICLGDWGFAWPGPHNWQVDVDKLARKLTANGQTLYFVDGNHEAFPTILKFPIGAGGLRWIRPTIARIPRGWRTTIGDKYRLGALGGANSIDYQYRTRNVDWWPQYEQISPPDLEALGSDRAEVLVGHEVPLGVPSLDRYLSSLQRWPVDAEVYAGQSRYMFHLAVMQTRPQLTLGGHYHHFVDETVTYTDDAGAFICRVVALDRNGPGISQAILDTKTLGLEFLHLDGTAGGTL